MRVTIRGSGQQENVEGQVDPTFQAIRVSQRPLEWNAPAEAGGGHFYFEAATGALTGSGANGPLLSMRWSDSAHFYVLKRCSMWYYLTTAYTTPQMNDFELVRATSFSAADTGGAVVVPLKKRRANMGDSLVGDLRVATTAALGAGTRTLDAAGVRAVVDGPPNVAIPTSTLAVLRQELLLYDSKEMAVHPLVLGRDEGLIVRNITAMGAVGVMKAYFQMEWAEVAQF